MNTMPDNGHDGKGPHMARVEEQIAEVEDLEIDEDLKKRAAQGAGAIAFIHFDPSSAKSNIGEALVHHDDLTKVHRGLYVNILSTKDGRSYTGRIVEGPFFAPDALKRDSTPVQFIVMNQGQGKVLSLPEYHGWIEIEILGEEKNGELYGATRRPHPASPVLPYDSTKMTGMLHLEGNIILGIVDNYEDVLLRLDENAKGVMPRNWLTVGTIGSGKSNTNQVFIEETLANGYAQVVIDPEGEYIYMDQPSEALNIATDLKPYEREPRGVKNLTVYRPPLAESKREGAIEFSVPFDSIGPDLIVELVEMSPAQQTRFTFLYSQAVDRLQKEKGAAEEIKNEDVDLSRGYPGIKLHILLEMLREEIAYYHWKQAHKGVKRAKAGPTRKNENDDLDQEVSDESPEMKIYCHRYQLQPLIQDQQDLVSYAALSKKLRELQMTGIFDKAGVPALDMKTLSQPGHLSVIDMSDARNQYIVNIVITDLLTRMYYYKMELTEEQNAQKKVFITIEEAHGFVSREKVDQMQQTLDQLRRIARRGRKRWLALHFITQAPMHLPPELFELANNKIIHQTTGMENLRVMKSAAGGVNEAIWSDVPSLGRGRAIIVCSQYSHPIVVRIRPAASRRNYMV